MIFKRFSLIILSIILVLSFATPSFACDNENQSSNGSGFNDVGDGHWAKDAIKWMVSKKIVSGYPDQTFKPNNNITRGEFAKMMVLALGLKLEKPITSSFKDIDLKNWAFAYVETAKAYLTGYRNADGDYFKPSESALREDMAVALVKAKELAADTYDLSVLDAFGDSNQISPNLKKYCAIAVKNSIMSGYGSGTDVKTFKPKAILTRAEASVLLYNVMNLEKVAYDDGEKVTYDNNTVPANNSDSADNKYAAVSGNIIDGKIVLSWSKAAGDNFSFYKVVISKNNANPKYPDDGYLYYITDINTTTKTIETSDYYNGGDINGNLIAGESYYFSITAVFGNNRYAGNSIKLTVPQNQ